MRIRFGRSKIRRFIPWDDDVDVALPRDAYEIFLEKAPTLLPSYLFLQNYQSEPYFTHCFTKLRNSNTTYIEKSVAQAPIHHGVYIDIFPIDGYPSGGVSSTILEIRKKVFLSLMSANYHVPHSWKGAIFASLGKCSDIVKNLPLSLGNIRK